MGHQVQRIVLCVHAQKEMEILKFNPNGASIPLKISRSSFMTFSPRVSRTFWYQIYPGGTYGTTFMVQ